MKKFLAILLAMMLVMVSVAAMAADGENGEDGSDGGTTTVTTPAKSAEYEPGTGNDEGEDEVGTPRLQATLENGGTITLEKWYSYKKGETVAEGAKLPKTNIKFEAELIDVANSTIKPEDMNNDKVTITYNNPTEAGLDLSKEAQQHGTVTIKFPTYKEVGIYTYTVTESEEENKATAGVKYSDQITMKVTVVRLNETLQIAGVAFRVEKEGDKLGEITNEYKAGNLKVSKDVSGNMGDQKRPFAITVTFSAPEGTQVGGTISYTGAKTGTIASTEWTKDSTTGCYTKIVNFELKHGESVVFTNIPDTVTYTIIEDEYDEETGKGTLHTRSATEEQNKDYAYYVTDEVSTATAIASGVETEKIIKNKKDVTIDTGITLETLPYVLMMALAMMGLVVLKLRKREEY